MAVCVSLQKCELCPTKEGALKRTDSGSKFFLVRGGCQSVFLLEILILEHKEALSLSAIFEAKSLLALTH